MRVGIFQVKEESRLRLMPDKRIQETSQARATGAAEPQLQPQPVEIGALFAAHHQQVSVWVRRLGGPHIEVDDAVQEVFLLAHRRFHRFNGRERLIVWLYRVTENVVRHQRRRLRRQRRVLVEGAGQPDLTAPIASAGELASEEETKRHGLELIYEVLDRMSERNRTLIVLFELEELSGQEIAELKGAKVATVWVWLHRARAEFRRRLAALERTSPNLPGLQR